MGSKLTKAAPDTPPKGCWMVEPPSRIDCNCHFTDPPTCNPGPPPLPESMAEWLYLPPPPKRKLETWETQISTLQKPPAQWPAREAWRRPWAKRSLMPQDLAEFLGDEDLNTGTGLDDHVIVQSSVHVERRQIGEPTDTLPGTNAYGPVPFNGLAYPVEALMPDELGAVSFTRTTYYNRHLEKLLFSHPNEQYLVWLENKMMPASPRLTVFRLWDDNVTYLADWDPRVALNTLAATVLYHYNVPQDENIFNEILKLMPARHIFALQYCAKRSVELAVNEVDVLFKRYRPSHAHTNAPYIIFLLEMYKTWKEITGLDVARYGDPWANNEATKGVSGKPDKRHWDPPKQDAPKEGPRPGEDHVKNYGKPWYESPYHEGVQKVEEIYKSPAPEAEPWEPDGTHKPNSVPWDYICNNVWTATYNFNSKEHFHMPRFEPVVQAWWKLEARLTKIGHGHRAGRMRRLWELDKKLRQKDMCKRLKNDQACIALGHAMNMITLAVLQQLGDEQYEAIGPLKGYGDDPGDDEDD